MNEFIREPRYVVLKITDIHAHLSAAQIDALQTAGETIAVGRANAGRPPFNAVVVEQDWPEFEPTWAAIEARMTGRAPKPAECEPVVRLSLYPSIEAMLLCVLWHHQGASSPVGQPIRKILGIGQHDHLTPEQLSKAKSVSITPPGSEPVATVTISHFRGSKAMENRDFDYFGDLPEGTHRLFTTPQPCNKCEWHVEEIKRLKEEVNRLAAIKYKHFNGDDCWIYQEAGENYLDSLVCPVVITPKQLLALQAKVSELEQAYKDKDDAATQLVTAMRDMAGRIVELTKERDEEQIVGDKLFAKLTRAEAVIEKCLDVIAWVDKYVSCAINGSIKEALAAITEYREGK